MNDCRESVRGCQQPASFLSGRISANSKIRGWHGLFPCADAFGGGVGGVGGPDGAGGSDGGAFYTYAGDGAGAVGVHGEPEESVGTFDVAVGGDEAGGVSEFGRDLEKDDAARVIGVVGGGHHIEEGGPRCVGWGDSICGPGAVLGVPSENGGTYGLGDGGDLRFFGGFDSAVDGGGGEAGEESYDGDDHQ